MAGGPPDAVLHAWRVHGAERLHGGQGEAFRSEHLVFKPTRQPERTCWLAEVLSALGHTNDLRISRPAQSAEGDWVVGGWSAWNWLEGQPWDRSMTELVNVSRHFHAAVSRIKWSPSIRGNDRWSVADRLAWDESDHRVPRHLQPLAAARRPVHLPSQFIHGDLFGNVLTHSQNAPAVIDVSPYWRPATYAEAVLAVDDAVWHPGGGQLLDELLDRRDDRQLLIRAALFRALSEPGPTDAYGPLMRRLLAAS